MKLQGKTIWITGASSGIGEALVKRLASEQVNLVLSSRNEKELERVQREAGLTLQNSMVLPLDLEKMDDADRLTREVSARFGKIDILINNGGLSQRSLIRDTPVAVDRKLMEINYFGTIALTKSVLPGMILQRSGLIVVTSSVAGKFGFFLRSAYSASKHALHGFFESLRMELAPDNIKVLIVCPGKIATHISENALTSTGHANNKMDRAQAKGMSATGCAEKIIAGICNDKEELIIGNSKERMAVFLKRFSPAFFSAMIRKQKIE